MFQNNGTLIFLHSKIATKPTAYVQWPTWLFFSKMLRAWTQCGPRTRNVENLKLQNLTSVFDGSDHTPLGPRQFPGCTETCSASQRLSNRSLQHLELLYLFPRNKNRTCMSRPFCSWHLSAFIHAANVGMLYRCDRYHTI